MQGLDRLSIFGSTKSDKESLFAALRMMIGDGYNSEMTLRHRFCLAIVIVSGSFAGCSAKSNVGTVSGTIKLDGAPLKSGLVRFMPVDGKTASADAKIVDGKYSAEVPPGEKKLSFSSPKVVGQKKMYDTPDSPMIDITEEMLPAKYNSKSEEKMTVTAGSQTKDFELSSK